VSWNIGRRLSICDARIQAESDLMVAGIQVALLILMVMGDGNQPMELNMDRRFELAGHFLSNYPRCTLSIPAALASHRLLH